MSVPTARRAVTDELHPLLAADGWRSRASGWWSRDLGSGWSAVVALGVSVEHSPTGEGRATLHIGARADALEDQVATICGSPASYQQRTINKSIGYLMPEAGWREWLVAPSTTDAVAREIAAVLQVHGVPFLRSVVADPDAILAETGRVLDQAPAYARHALMVDRLRGTQAARRALTTLRERLSDRTDAAAQQARKVLAELERII